jgi:hypothetical protein
MTKDRKEEEQEKQQQQIEPVELRSRLKKTIQSHILNDLIIFSYA